MFLHLLEDGAISRLSAEGFPFPFSTYPSRRSDHLGLHPVPATQPRKTLEGASKIESDATASSYFLALPVATGGYCEVNDYRENSLQGDVKFLKILHKIGLKCVSNESGARTEKIEPPIGGKFDFNDISDTFLTLAAVAPLLQSPVSITGIAHTRMQETDRIKAMAIELR